MKQISGTPEAIRSRLRRLRIRKTKITLDERNNIEGTDNKNRCKYWQDLLGLDLTSKLIHQAHLDAKNFKQLVAEEAEITKARQQKGGDIYYKTLEKSNARKQLARGASAAT